MALLNSIFGAGNFSPHGFCVSWNPLLIWTEAISDSLIAAAYFSIPVVLSIFLMRRHDLVFPWVFALFGSFILLCGATHVLGAVTFWFPAYGIEAILKVLTAIVSIVTAIALWPLLPRALALPSPAALRAANDTLATEVEQRKEAEQSMRSLNDALKAQAIEGRWREHRFQLFMEAVADCAIIMLDTDGIVVSWNTGAGYLKGYMDSEIVGRHFSAFYTDADKVAGKPAQGLEIAAARGRFSDEVWRVRKDGSQFWAGVVITAIRDEHDKLLGFGIVTHDLTDRQHQQRRLTDANLELERRVLERTASLSDLTKRLESEIQERREATELLEKTFDATPLPMMISDAKSNVLMWNKAGEKTFGFTQAEMIEGGFGLLVADGGQAETNRVREAARRGQVTLMPRIRHRDGHMLDLHIIVTPLFRADGAIRATVTMLEDLTQRNLIDAQLRQSQKMEAIGTLTGGMAHDFNNLLGIIIGNLDMLRDARANDPDIDELAGEALDAAMRGAELTRSLLAFARRQPLQPKHLDLDVVIAGVVNLLSRTLGEDIEIALNFSQNLCSVVADPAQLEASLINLATNARDAMPRGGKLTVATMHQTLRADDVAANPDVPPGDYAVIEVTDTGEGMTPEVRSRIFEPFFTTKDERGTGLGLSMVFGFMKQSGGHLSVYSEPGVGTTFRLYFPCSLADLEVEYDLGPDDLLRGHGETILAVEDSDPLRRIVVRQLTGLGYRVIEASTGSAALAILATEHVDLLFTDVVMPGGVDGVALVAIATERHPNLKVILTSGFPRTRFVDQIAQNEPPLLSKPYRKDDLARLVRAVINGNDAASDV